MTGKDHDAGDVLVRGARMRERGEAFALATVVGREAPSSARMGDRALVEADGTLHGWIGGSCIEEVVRREARIALRERRPRIVVLSPDATSNREGAVVHPMTCHSGGTVEVHVQPEVPRPVIELYGESPVTHALAAMAGAAGFRVRAHPEPAAVGAGASGAPAAPGGAPGEEGGEPVRGEPEGGHARPGGAFPVGGPSPVERFAVVATMGSWDERATERALAGPAVYSDLNTLVR